MSTIDSDLLVLPSTLLGRFGGRSCCYHSWLDLTIRSGFGDTTVGGSDARSFRRSRGLVIPRRLSYILFLRPDCSSALGLEASSSLGSRWSRDLARLARIEYLAALPSVCSLECLGSVPRVRSLDCFGIPATFGDLRDFALPSSSADLKCLYRFPFPARLRTSQGVGSLCAFGCFGSLGSLKCVVCSPRSPGSGTSLSGNFDPFADFRDPRSLPGLGTFGPLQIESLGSIASTGVFGVSGVPEPLPGLGDFRVCTGTLGRFDAFARPRTLQRVPWGSRHLGGIARRTKPFLYPFVSSELFIRLGMTLRVTRFLYLGQASSSLGEIISGLCA